MSIQIEPVRRNLRFALPRGEALTWHPAGLHVTQFFNTLSLFFPAGERFFIQSVRNYRNEITDAKMKAHVSAFIGQEAFHTREHEQYNAALQEAGLPVEVLERVVERLLANVARLPRPIQLAATVALEHLTAVLGDMLLRNEELLKDVEPHFAALWRWHAIEETEHKAVCFDAFESVVEGEVRAYGLRIVAFVLANMLFWSLFVPFYTVLIARSGGLFDLRGWWSVGNLVAGRPGVLRRALPDWLSFFRPGFHPWQHDNREFLAQAEALTSNLNTNDVEPQNAA